MKKQTRSFNIHRLARTHFIRKYLFRTIRLDDPAMLMSWQPLYLILMKTAVAAGASALLFGLHGVLGGWLEKGFAFFKFDEIYNFRFPGRSFFDGIARIVVLIVICYYGLYVIGHLLQGLFSALVVSAREGKIYYVRNFLFKKALFVFPIPETDAVAMKQNALSRLLGVGTIVLSENNGDKVEVRGLAGPEEILRKIVSPEAPRDRSGFSFPGE